MLVGATMVAATLATLGDVVTFVAVVIVVAVAVALVCLLANGDGTLDDLAAPLTVATLI